MYKCFVRLKTPTEVWTNQFNLPLPPFEPGFGLKWSKDYLVFEEGQDFRVGNVLYNIVEGAFELEFILIANFDTTKLGLLPGWVNSEKMNPQPED